MAAWVGRRPKPPKGLLRVQWPQHRQHALCRRVLEVADRQAAAMKTTMRDDDGDDDDNNDDDDDDDAYRPITNDGSPTGCRRQHKRLQATS